MNITKTALYYIETLGLQPHEEGGYFSIFYRSPEFFYPSNKRYDGNARCTATSIYYLLEKEDFSAWHILNSDEIWHHYAGTTARIYKIKSNGELIVDILGDPLETENAAFQVIVPAKHWFAVELVDKTSFALMGCLVSPGFEVADFRLADRTTLSKQFPKHKNLITKLTNATN